MARKWSNLNLPGALHFVTGNCLERTPVFTEPACCNAFLQELKSLNQKWPSKLIAYVLMPDHFHLISNPRDGRIKEFVGALKRLSAKSIVNVCKQFRFHADAGGHQVWQESFKALPLWSEWMIWQKDQLHSCQSGESWNREVCQGLSLVELQILLLARRGVACRGS